MLLPAITSQTSTQALFVPFFGSSGICQTSTLITHKAWCCIIVKSPSLLSIDLLNETSCAPVILHLICKTVFLDFKSISIEQSCYRACTDG